MDRVWLLTNGFYGTWLPGDTRGFVGHVLEHRVDDSHEDARVVHNAVGTEYESGISGLEAAARERMNGPPIYLNVAQAEVVLSQFLETAKFRHWMVLACAVMFNHFHLVVGVLGDPKPSKILGDFKSWGTRRLSNKFGAPASKTWWTSQGSKRKLCDEDAVASAIVYVLEKQPNPLALYRGDLASGTA